MQLHLFVLFIAIRETAALCEPGVYSCGLKLSYHQLKQVAAFTRWGVTEHVCMRQLRDGLVHNVAYVPERSFCAGDLHLPMYLSQAYVPEHDPSALTATLLARDEASCDWLREELEARQPPFCAHQSAACAQCEEFTGGYWCPECSLGYLHDDSRQTCNRISSMKFTVTRAEAASNHTLPSGLHLSPDRAFDGGAGASVEGGDCMQTGGEGTQWVNFHLQNAVLVKRLRILARDDCCANEMSGASVLVCKHGSDRCSPFATVGDVEQGQWVELQGTSEVGNLVRLEKEGAIVICEIEVHGTIPELEVVSGAMDQSEAANACAERNLQLPWCTHDQLRYFRIFHDFLDVWCSWTEVDGAFASPWGVHLEGKAVQWASDASQGPAVIGSLTNATVRRTQPDLISAHTVCVINNPRVNECLDPRTCGSRSLCTDTLDSHTCSCGSGYFSKSGTHTDCLRIVVSDDQMSYWEALAFCTERNLQLPACTADEIAVIFPLQEVTSDYIWCLWSDRHQEGVWFPPSLDISWAEGEPNDPHGNEDFMAASVNGGHDAPVSFPAEINVVCVAGEDVDECVSLPGICGDNAACSNTYGSYSCACEDGFFSFSGHHDDCLPLRFEGVPDGCTACTSCQDPACVFPFVFQGHIHFQCKWWSGNTQGFWCATAVHPDTLTFIDWKYCSSCAPM